MKILIKAKPNAKVDKVEELQPLSGMMATHDPGLRCYKVSVKAAPTDGKANDAIVHIVAKYFKVHARNVRIISGITTSQKIVEITV